MAVFFLFLRNVLLPIEILKIKILEHSDPPSQHFFVHKAFSHSFLCRRKVVLCHLAEWHIETCLSLFQIQIFNIVKILILMMHKTINISKSLKMKLSEKAQSFCLAFLTFQMLF